MTNTSKTAILHDDDDIECRVIGYSGTIPVEGIVRFRVSGRYHAEGDIAKTRAISGLKPGDLMLWRPPLEQRTVIWTHMSVVPAALNHCNRSA